MTSKALIYCRVSSKKQVKEGDGLGSQEFRCLQFAASRGLEIEQVFHDEGVSGGYDLFQRPAMKKLLDFLDQHPNETYYVIFDDLKRFARDTLLHFKLKQELALRGAKPLCPTFTFEESPEGRFIETLYAAFGQLERQQNQRQVMNRMKARLERGYWVFRNPPAGYEFDSDPVHGKILKLQQPTARRVKTALKGFASGRFYEKRDVLKFLQKNPLKSQGHPINSDYNLVNRILGNLFYTGWIEYPKWGVKRVKGHHKALITLEEHQRILHRLQIKPTKIRLDDQTEFPLTGLIRCSYCKENYTCSRSKGRSKHYFYYTCKNKECVTPLKNLPKHDLESQYHTLLQETVPPSEILQLLMDQLRRAFKNQQNIQAGALAKAKRNLHSKQKEMDQFLDRACTANSDQIRDRYEQRAEEIQVEITKLKLNISNLKKSTIKDVLDMAENFMRTAPESWEKRTRQEKITIHRLLFPTQLYYGQNTGWRTASKPLPTRVCEQLKGSKFTMVDLDENTANQLLETFLSWEVALRGLRSL